MQPRLTQLPPSPPPPSLPLLRPCPTLPPSQVYFIDGDATSADTVANITAKGYHPVCYFSAGSYEDWRDDAKDFLPGDYGNPLKGWPGEYWINITSPNVKTIMAKVRTELCVQRQGNCGWRRHAERERGRGQRGGGGGREEGWSREGGRETNAQEKRGCGGGRDRRQQARVTNGKHRWL